MLYMGELTRFDGGFGIDKRVEKVNKGMWLKKIFFWELNMAYKVTIYIRVFLRPFSSLTPQNTYRV